MKTNDYVNYCGCNWIFIDMDEKGFVLESLSRKLNKRITVPYSCKMQIKKGLYDSRSR